MEANFKAAARTGFGPLAAALPRVLLDDKEVSFSYALVQPVAFFAADGAGFPGIRCRSSRG
jgi:hypothetical protein